eukprot:990870-Alexandrium_andersonii.AAC.1
MRCPQRGSARGWQRAAPAKHTHARTHARAAPVPLGPGRAHGGGATKWSCEGQTTTGGEALRKVLGLPPP